MNNLVIIIVDVVVPVAFGCNFGGVDSLDHGAGRQRIFPSDDPRIGRLSNTRVFKKCSILNFNI